MEVCKPLEFGICGAFARIWDCSMLTQIYEISSPDEGRGVSEIGIDHVGVLVGDGEFPREQPLSRRKGMVMAID